MDYSASRVCAKLTGSAQQSRKHRYTEYSLELLPNRVGLEQ